MIWRDLGEIYPMRWKKEGATVGVALMADTNKGLNKRRMGKLIAEVDMYNPMCSKRLHWYQYQCKDHWSKWSCFHPICSWSLVSTFYGLKSTVGCDFVRSRSVVFSFNVCIRIICNIGSTLFFLNGVMICDIAAAHGLGFSIHCRKYAVISFHILCTRYV